MVKNIFIRWIVPTLSGELFIAWLLPATMPVVTVMVGAAQEIPWFYIWLGALAAFALSANGLLRFSEWRDRNSGKHKLAFDSVRINVCGENGNIERVRVGLLLRNRAHFPIQFRIDRLMTSVGESTSPKRDYENPVIDIPAVDIGWYDDFDIPLKISSSCFMEGVLDFQLAYGRPSNLRYKLKQKKRLYLSFLPDEMEARFHWSDLETDND